MSDFVITIGREHGSGGRYIGEMLAERLGVKCWNSELVSQTAMMSGFSEKFVRENEEKRPESLLFSIAMSYSVTGAQPVTAKLFGEQARVIEDISKKGSCVIIGRAADYVLRDHPHLLRVFVSAPMKDRIARVCRLDGVDEAEAEKLIKKMDKQRAAYISFYTDRVWGEAKNYDVTLNTGLLGIEGAVELLEKAARRVFSL